MKYVNNFKSFESKISSNDVHYAYIQKIEDDIDNLLDGQYDNDIEILKNLESAILKLSITEKREKALNYIKERGKISNIEEDIEDILLELIDGGKVRVGFNDPYRKNKFVMIRTSQADKAIYWKDLSEYVNRIVDYLGDNFTQLRIRKHANYREDKTNTDWIEINPNEDNSNINYGLWSVVIKFDI